MSANLIPGNTKARRIAIWDDTTKEYLEVKLEVLINNQKASHRDNPVFKTEVRRLRLAIASR